MNWKFTHIDHPIRKKLGINLNEYAVFDIIYQSQVHPTYKTGDGWCSHSYQEIADGLGLSKGAVFAIIERGVEWGVIEVDAAHPEWKKTTSKWYDVVYVENPSEAYLESLSTYRSKNERSKNERQTVQKMNDSVQKMNDNKSKLKQSLNNKNISISCENEKIENDLESHTNSQQNKEAPPGSAPPPPFVDWNSPAAYLEAARLAKEYLTGEGESLLEGMAGFSGSTKEEVLAMVDTFFAKHCDSSHILRNWNKQFGQIQNWQTLQKKRDVQQSTYRNGNNGASQVHAPAESSFDRILRSLERG